MTAVLNMLDAALAYAARGWPVFPCDPRTKRPLLPMDRDADDKPIKGTGGVKKASTDADQIRAWWSKWTHAMIGVAVGAAGLLVIDFDPRTDPIIDKATGEVVGEEVWTLDRLKAALAGKAGVALPDTLVGITRSGGEHHWFRMPAGDPIGNVGSLPLHVDVRGAGGYVIVAPSRFLGNETDAAGEYSWLTDDDASRIAELPAELVELMRRPARREKGAAHDLRTSDRQPTFTVDVDEVHRRYALHALDSEVSELAATPKGGGRHNGRNQGAYWAAFNLGQFVGAGVLGETIVRQSLLEVVRGFDPNAYQQHADAIENGLTNGRAKPSDLSSIGTRRSTSSSPRSVGHRPFAPIAAYGDQSPTDPARHADRRSRSEATSHDGKVAVRREMLDARQTALIAARAKHDDALRCAAHAAEQERIAVAGERAALAADRRRLEADRVALEKEKAEHAAIVAEAHRRLVADCDALHRQQATSRKLREQLLRAAIDQRAEVEAARKDRRDAAAERLAAANDREEAVAVRARAQATSDKIDAHRASLVETFQAAARFRERLQRVGAGSLTQAASSTRAAVEQLAVASSRLRAPSAETRPQILGVYERMRQAGAGLA